MKKMKMILHLLLVLALVTVPVASLTARAEVEEFGLISVGDDVYETIQDALYAVGNGGTIRLLDDLVVGGADREIKLSEKTVTIDLYEHTLKGNGNEDLYWKNGNVTITGSGTIGRCVLESNCNMTLEDVTAEYIEIKDASLTVNNAEVEELYVRMGSNKLNITGGTIKKLIYENIAEGQLYESDVKLSGGSYGSISFPDTTVGNLLAEVYTYRFENGKYASEDDLSKTYINNVEVVEKPDVARIDGNLYKSLKEAFDKASPGKTITIVCDVTIAADEAFEVKENITLEVGAGITLTVKGELNVASNAKIVNNGTVVNDGTLIIKGSGNCNPNAAHLPKTDACECQICGGTVHRQESDSYTSTATGHKPHYPCCDTYGAEEAHSFNETSGLCDTCEYNMAVAMVDNIYYETFDEALDGWTNDTKMTLLKDVEHTDEIKIEGKAVTLDLNGHTMSCTNRLSVDSGGGLIVKDSSESHNGQINNNGNNYAIYSEGKLTIEGGTIISTDQYSVAVLISKGALTVSGGTIRNADGSYALTVESRATSAEITGGTIEGKIKNGCSDLTIKNATIDGYIYIYKGKLTIGSGVTISGKQAISWYEGDIDLSEAGRVDWAIKADDTMFTPGTLTLPKRCELRVGTELVDKLEAGQTGVISKKTVTITVDDLTISYGETYAESDCTTIGLVSDDALSVGPDGFIASTTNVTDCGTVSIDQSKIQVVGDGGTDVTEYYDFKIVPGTLTIEPDLTELEALDLDAVKSDDRETIEEVQTILKAGKFTNKEWLDALEKCEDLLDKLDAVDAAASTENIQQAENVTESNVKLTDLTVLEKAKADLNKALEENAGNYTDEETEAIQEELERINELLDAINDVRILTEAIAKVTDPVSPDDLDGAAHILDLLDDYNKMSAAQKAMVSTSTKEKLDGLVKCLTDYKIIKGDGASWTAESGGSLTITANGALSKFTGLLVDGKAVDKANYEAKSGSTIITLKESYVKSLTDGEHTFTFLYTDGRTDGSFAIIPLSANDTGNGTNNGTNNGTGTGNGTNNSTTSNTPATGDTSHVTVWIVLLALSACAGTAVVIGKRKAK